MNVKSLEQITYTDFAGAVNGQFRVQVDAQSSVSLKLAGVTPLRISSGGTPPAASYENFTLNFIGPVDALLSQKIYRFESAALGHFDLFIVPASVSTASVEYQATFHRLQKTD